MFDLGCVLLIVQRLSVAETIRQARRARNAILQRMETEIEGALVHGEFDLYHDPNVHTSIHDFMSFALIWLIRPDVHHNNLEQLAGCAVQRASRCADMADGSVGVEAMQEVG